MASTGKAFTLLVMLVISPAALAGEPLIAPGFLDDANAAPMATTDDLTSLDSGMNDPSAGDSFFGGGSGLGGLSDDCTPPAPGETVHLKLDCQADDGAVIGKGLLPDANTSEMN